MWRHFSCFVHVVNIEKFQYLNIIVKGLMCQVDFLSDRNLWYLLGYKSQWSCYFRTSMSCLVGEVRVGKKHYELVRAAEGSRVDRGNFPPQSLTEPYVTVSRHTALQLVISKQILPH